MFTRISSALLQRAMQHAARAGARRLILRVNRHNRVALSAYAKFGFRVYAEDVLDIGNGFVMDDFLMELQLCS
jgi:diamine N-acetyltransferase